jgi:hypothetical protein
MIHQAFAVRADVHHLREDLRVRASYLAGKVIEPRLRSLIMAAVDEEASDKDWLKSLVMIIADRPAETWANDDLLAFEMNVAEMARRFVNLEALQKQVASAANEGYDARRVTITEPSGEEVHRLIWIDRQQLAAVEAHADLLLKAIRSRVADEHQQQAILMTLLERMLGKQKLQALEVADGEMREQKHA